MRAGGGGERWKRGMRGEEREGGDGSMEGRCGGGPGHRRVGATEERRRTGLGLGADVGDALRQGGGWQAKRR